MVGEQALLAKYVNLNTKNNNNNVNFVTGKDENYNYYKIKYTTSNSQKINQLEDIISSMKYNYTVAKPKKESSTKRPKSGSSKKKFKEFITSLNISRPPSANNEEVIDKAYVDNIKKELFSNDIVIGKIVSHFDVDKDNTQLLNDLMFLNKKINRIVTKHVYRNVDIESTYKLAQFLHTIKNDMMKKYFSKNLNSMVESIDLSGIKSGAELFKLYCVKNKSYMRESLEDMSLATWRDWRMKDSKIYGRNILEMQRNIRKRSKSNASIAPPNAEIPSNPAKKIKSSKMVFSKEINNIINKILLKKRKITTSTTTLGEVGKLIHLNPLNKIKHPMINLHLKKYKDNRDVPIGYIIHILKYFQNLKVLNLDHLSISEDFIFLHNTLSVETPDLAFVKEYFRSRNDEFKFLSDTGINSFNLKMDKNIFGLTFSNFFEIFTYLVNDINLECLSLRNCYFVKKLDVEKLLAYQYAKHNAMNIDFYKSTMNKGYLWCNTPTIDSEWFLIFFFLCNLIENVRKLNYLSASAFSKISFLNTGKYIFKLQYFSLNGEKCKDNNKGLRFVLCFGLNETGGFDCKLKKIDANTIQINLFFGLETYMDTESIFLKENEFFNFHSNMSYLRLGESIRNADVDPRYYNLKILGEYLLMRLKIEYLIMKHKTIGYNMIEAAY